MRALPTPELAFACPGDASNPMTPREARRAAAGAAGLPTTKSPASCTATGTSEPHLRHHVRPVPQRVDVIRLADRCGLAMTSASARGPRRVYTARTQNRPGPGDPRGPRRAQSIEAEGIVAGGGCRITRAPPKHDVRLAPLEDLGVGPAAVYAPLVTSDDLWHAGLGDPASPYRIRSAWDGAGAVRDQLVVTRCVEVGVDRLTR